MRKVKCLVPVLVLIVVSLLTVSCDDLINVDSGSSDPVLNIDAWVNDKPEVQTIYLTMTQDYFDNENLPPEASGATVKIVDDQNQEYEFLEDPDSDDGAYRWYPSSSTEQLVERGRSYTLYVIYNNETFQASCKAGRVPAVDSVTMEFEEGEGFIDDMYRAQFWATDPAGKGDTYWIKSYKNGTLLNKTSEINIAYDAGMSSANGFDGVTFISVIRGGINARDVDEDDRPESPFEPGDSVYVEIHSLTEASFNYMNEVITQTDRAGGLGELFTSTPLANVSTNVVNLDGNGSPVVGFFNTATTSGYGKILKKP